MLTAKMYESEISYILSTDESINERIFARLNESHLIFQRNTRILCRKLFLMTMYKSNGKKKLSPVNSTLIVPGIDVRSDETKIQFQTICRDS